MRPISALLPSGSVALALLRGAGELAMLQRWRLRDWMLRRPR